MFFFEKPLTSGKNICLGEVDITVFPLQKPLIEKEGQLYLTDPGCDNFGARNYKVRIPVGATDIHCTYKIAE
jgi:hypothetical protein